MNTLNIYNIPDINNIITDYKNQLDHQSRFKKSLDDIKKIEYHFQNNNADNVDYNTHISNITINNKLIVYDWMSDNTLSIINFTDDMITEIDDNNNIVVDDI